MIRVRRHRRQMASGKVTTVTQHDRNVVVRDQQELDDDWRDRQQEQPPASVQDDHPEGTVYFRKDDDLFAVHPDGTVHQVPETVDEAAERHDDDMFGPADAEPERAAGPPEMSRKEQLRQARAEAKAAQERLQANTDEEYERHLANGGRRGQMPESPAYHALNEAVWQADEKVRRLRRGGRKPDNPAFNRAAGKMREWRARPVPAAKPEKPMNPALARALGCDTPEGLERYDRGRAYREAGYDGPLDEYNRIPDPDDPANWETIDTLGALGEL